MTRNDIIIDKAVSALSASVNSILADPACNKALAMATTFTQCRNFLQSNVVKLSPPNDPPDPDDDEPGDNDTTALPPKLEQAIAALITAHPQFDRQSAADFLINTPHGRALTEHLSKQQKGPTTMTTTRADGLRDIAKQYGVARIAKMIVMEGTSHGISEAELTELAAAEFSKRALPGERANTTFARLYSLPENLELRQALQVAKSTPVAMPVEPVQPAAATVSDADSAAAMAKLEKMAAELRTTSPELSKSQSFAKVFLDPANASIANAAHRRPSATTSYALPR